MMYLKKISASIYSPAYAADWHENSKFKEGDVGKFVKSSLRSAEQNAGYWSVIIPQVVEQLEARGTEFPVGFEKEDVIHGLLHKLFLTTEFMGERVTISTAKLTKEQFTEFYEKIAKWYAESFYKELKMPEKQI